MTTFGPWTISSILSDANSKQIAAVTSDKQPGSWVIKIKTNKDHEELRCVLNLIAGPRIRHMIEFPANPYHLFGQTEEAVWFAMRRYDGHVTKAHRGSWKKIAIAGIEFLQDIHRDHNNVYMDIRPENIMVDAHFNTFHFGDFELVDAVNKDLTESYQPETISYFMAKGAQLKQPLYSWRQDLRSLGQLLINLTESEEPEINLFMNTIKKVKWTAVKPPPKSFYIKLASMFE